MILGCGSGLGFDNNRKKKANPYAQAVAKILNNVVYSTMLPSSASLQLNNLVYKIEDKSLKEITAQQNIEGIKPIKTGSFIDFYTESPNYMDVPGLSNLPNKPANYNIFAVIVPKNITKNRFFWGSSGGSGTTTWGALGISSSGYLMSLFGAGSTLSMTGISSYSPVPDKKVLYFHRNIAASPYHQIRVNNTNLTLTTQGNTTAPAGVAYPFTIGSWGKSTYYVQPFLYFCFICIIGQMSDADINTVCKFLQWEYGL